MGMNSGFVGADQRQARNGIVGLDKTYLQHATGEWVPLDISGLDGAIGWYDASDSGTLTLDGSNVNNWRSKAGTSEARVINMSVIKPVLVDSSLKFASGYSTSPLLIEPITNLRTIFCVVRHDTGTNNGYTQCLFGHNTGNSPFPSSGNTYMIGENSQSESLHVRTGKAYVNGAYLGSPLYLFKRTYYQVICIEAAGDVTVSQIAGHGTNNNNTWNGNFQEIIFTTRIYSPVIRDKVTDYLLSKWNITPGQ